MLRYMELIHNPRRFLALTGYTVDEFRALLSFFRVRFQAYVARFTLEGKPRQNRTYSTYKNSTFSTMEDILLFIEDVENHVLRAWSESNGFAS